MADIMGLDKLINKKKEQEEVKKPSVRESLQAQTGVPSFVPTTQETQLPGVQDVQKRTEERKAVEQIAKVPAIKKPEDFSTIMSKIDKISSGMSPEQKAEFEAKKAKIEEYKDAAEKQFQQSKNQNQWLQVAETLGQALVQLGAGAYGLKHNVDLSGLKFNKANWASNIEQAERDLNRKLGMAQEATRGIEKDQSALERKLTDNADFRKRAILQNYMAEQRAYQNQVQNAERLAAQIQKANERTASAADKAKAKQAEKQLQDAIQKQQRKVQLLDKAYGAAQGAAEGAKGASVDKVAQILGGEQGAEFKKDIETPVTLFGIELWKSSSDEEAPKVVKGYLDQAKAALESLMGKAKGLVSGESKPVQQPQAELTEQDMQALEWANANPNDPRAKEIKNRLGQ